MLLYGDAANIQDQCRIYNFTSFIEGYDRLNIVPPNSLGATSDFQFDQLYYDYIMTDDYRFCQMFNIVNLLREGQDVYIIISSDQWSETLMESLLKLIQQRYGYNGTRINCIQDVFTADIGDITNPQTLYNFDQDFERYEYILTSNGVRL